MKKKLFAFISLIACIFLLAGCSGQEQTKTMTCDKTMNQNNTEMDFHYAVTYSGEYVKTVETKEIMKSSNSATLEGYKEAIEKVYKNFDNIDHYDYNVTIEGDTLTSTVSIDYEKVDTDKLISIDKSVNQLIKDGKVKLSDIKSVYESIGATCKTE